MSRRYRPQPSPMFPDQSDLPLFSQTPIPAVDVPFLVSRAPAPAPQAEMFPAEPAPALAPMLHEIDLPGWRWYLGKAPAEELRHCVAAWGDCPESRDAARELARRGL